MSKINLRVLALFLILVGVSGLSYPARAEVKIAVVDVQALLTESKGAKSIQEQLNKQREKFQADVTAEEKKLKEDEQKLVEMRKQEQEKNPQPSPEFLEKKKAFEKQVADTRQKVQDRRQGLEKSTVDAMNELRKQVLEIVAGMTTEKGLDLVITKQNVIVGSKDLDMTAAVMEALNKKVDHIDLKAGTN
jgi:outer membrane protein